MIKLQNEEVFGLEKKKARSEPRLLDHVDKIPATCEEMPREELHEMYEEQALYAAQDIKTYCKSTVCEACTFWRVGSDEGFCELHDEPLPCEWEI